MQLFVYGTLKRGGCNHGRLTGQRFVGEARTLPGFTLYALDGYPGLVASPAASGVTGELWIVDAPRLADLDAFEGVDEGLYARQRINLAAPFATADAETYVYLRPLDDRREIGATWRE